MDKELIRKRFTKAKSTYNQEACVQLHIARQMNNAIIGTIPKEKRKNILEIGCGTGLFTRTYLNESKVNKLILNDICPEASYTLDDILSDGSSFTHASFLSGDAEALSLPSGIDMIASCSAIQWFENPLLFMKKCRTSLNDNGYLAISTFGPENMKEIRIVTEKTLNYIPLKEIKESLCDIYDIVYSSEELIKINFSTPLDVLKHLKKTGVNGIGCETWTKGRLKQFSDSYTERFADSGNSVSLTYNPIYLICRKKLPQ